MRTKSLIIIILFFITYPLLADCPHCFTIVKTKISYNNGESEIGFIKFFRSYEIENNDIRPKENEDIITCLPSNIDTIQLIDSIYKFKDLPYFINKEKTRNIPLKSIKGIYVLEWTKISGACNMPNLPPESIQRIKSSESLISNIKTFNVHDEIYIYTDGFLDNKEFDFLIENSYNYSEVGPSVINCLRSKGIRVKVNRNLYPKKADLELAFECYFEQIDRKILSISDIEISKNIDEYFDLLVNHFSMKKHYYKLVLGYLNSGNSNDILSFIRNMNLHPNFETMLTNKITKTENNESEIIKTAIFLIKSDYIFKNDSKEKVKFQQIITENNIIVLPVSWD